MNKAYAVDKLIQVAQGELGYLEKRSIESLDNKTANAGNGNYTKYWRDIYPEFQGQSWCAAFVSWCMMKAFGRAAAEKLASALNVRRWAGTKYPRLFTCPSIPAGTKVGICDTVKAENGKPWYYVLIDGHIYGFVSAAYVHILSCP